MAAGSTFDVAAFLDRLERAVSLESDDAAIRVRAQYAPQAGWTSKVFPPTYLPANGTKYHIEQRWGADGTLVDVVILDSYQSQANRAEAALAREAQSLGLPQLVLQTKVGDRHLKVSSLEAPHRSRDAYFRDCELENKPFDETPLGRSLAEATPGNETPFLEFAPYDLIYGVWDSHRGKRIALKFARAYTSEMIGWHRVLGYRAATKGDPLALAGRDTVPRADWQPGTASAQAKKAEVRLSELGHGMVPNAPDDQAGGVSVRAITRTAILSLNGLARYSFPEKRGDATAAGRVALAALALLGDRLAFGGAGLHLRSGSDLSLVSEELEWVRRGAELEPFELTPVSARDLFAAAKVRLKDAGVAWNGEPVLLQPTPRLQQAIESAMATGEIQEGT